MESECRLRRPRSGPSLQPARRIVTRHRLSAAGFADRSISYWKPEVQSYVHSYLAATGVDLTAVDVSDARRTAERNLQPSVHLRNRLADQQSRNVRAITAQAPMTQELSIAPAKVRSRLLSRTPRE